MPARPPWLRRQLLAWLLVPLFVLLTVDSFVSYGVALEFSRRAYDRSLVEIARDLSLHVRRAPGSIVLDLPEESRRILLEHVDDRIYHAVLAGDGTKVSGDVIPPRPNRDEAHEAFYDAQVDSAPVRVVELRMPAGAAGVPAARVRVAETMNGRNVLAREILLAVVLPQALLLVVAAVVVWIGVAHGLAPLERLRRSVEARSHREWRPVAEDDIPGEVRPLLQAIDELVKRLDHALTLQSRFIADAAHQLKTPIAALKANLELAVREHDPERSRQALAAAEAGVARLSRVVSQLLSLARNEPEGSHGVVLAPLDLGAVVLEAASAWVPAALKRNIDLGFAPPPAVVMVNGDAARMREMLDNLIDNAVRYTQAGGRITVHVQGSPPAVQVDDDGPRIPAQERQRVFERFHRLLGHVEGGSGLGLAIAQEIARLHEAQITLRDDDDGVGNTFRVEFPSHT